ncbi:unnamed protein product [Linum tenue]|uniref:Aminotransferase-like plant mobile domain-containing protein n=1 Tax=Linum tenue TaxID=586396 RepID=A0AAV0RL77_9ROSI|nr:unnamed protein product [Linum tenue]
MLRHFLRIEIDNDLLTAMAERWRPETHTFHLPEGEMTITLKDVAILTGMPISGDAVIGPQTKPDVGWGPLIRDRLGFDMPTTTPIQGRGHPPLNAGQVSVPWLVSHIQQEVVINDETPEEQVERYARIYLIGLVGGFLFPDKSNRWIQGIWLELLTGNIEWSSQFHKTRQQVSGSYMLSTSDIRQRTGSESMDSISTSGRIDTNGWCKGCRRRDRWATTMGTCSGIGSSP